MPRSRLEISSVNPDQVDLLFERFISEARNEPPDIDVDFEHERREEVMQYIYEKYGRDRAALTATVICYRRKSAMREVSKVLGLTDDLITLVSRHISGWNSDMPPEDRLQALGLDTQSPRLKLALEFADQIKGFPRHLSQHVGGFVLSDGPLDQLVPIENASMEDRTVIQWDKDDLEALGLMKVDVLALGMLSCIRKAFDLLASHYRRNFTLASLPQNDSATYDMLCRADSLGVFQVESRAQMNMLPRLRPRCYYDLVIQVAIVRPGPIQGDMVHPFLKRRQGLEKAEYPSGELREVLHKTMGVPIFQEQAMRIAMVGAGFSGEEADQLRRAMATFKKNGKLYAFEEKLIGGMLARGYSRDFAERCFKQLKGFGSYGFPESHAAAFALLAYVSSYLKCHYPEVFACALLNSQPMGFYAPAQIIRDAQDHGVVVLPPDVNYSDWDYSLEPSDGRYLYALRIGLRQVKGLKEADGRRIEAARGNGYADVLALWRRAGVPARALSALAHADAYGSMGLERRAAIWQTKALPDTPLPLFAASQEEDRGPEPAPDLPSISLGEAMATDYQSLCLSLKAHPCDLLREDLAGRGYAPLARQGQLKDGDRLRAAGLITCRQRPGSAKGVVFLTLEDEDTSANVVVWEATFKRFRQVVLSASLVGLGCRVQRDGAVIHLVAYELIDLSAQLARLSCGGYTVPAARASRYANQPAIPGK